MTQKEIIKKKDEQIDRLIDLVEKLILNQQNSYPVYPTTPLTGPCINGGQHDYPVPWHGTTPPMCKKCGKQGDSFPITY